MVPTPLSQSLSPSPCHSRHHRLVFGFMNVAIGSFFFCFFVSIAAYSITCFTTPSSAWVPITASPAFSLFSRQQQSTLARKRKQHHHQQQRQRVQQLLQPTCLAMTASSSSTTTSGAAAGNTAATTTPTTPTTMTEVLPAALLQEIAAAAHAYASANGLQVASRHASSNTDTVLFECAPMSLLPNAMPGTAFSQAKQVAPSLNILVDRISRDASFLQDTLGGGVAQTDPYTAKLLQLYCEIYVDPATASVFAQQADRLGIHRSDYMLHQKKDPTSANNTNTVMPYTIQQVELNTIASSFASLACRVAAMHRYLIERFQGQPALQAFLKANQDVVLQGTSIPSSSSIDFQVGVPDNPALQRIPAAFHAAVQRYADRHYPKTTTTSSSMIAGDQSKLAVLFVVQPGETNTVDQRMLEFALWQEHRIPVVRLSLAQIDDQVMTDPNTGALLHRDDMTEFAVVYYRAGYAPTDYPGGYDGVEWQARAAVEHSRATKSPCLGYHLAGTKKVQQALARPGILQRWFPDPESDVTTIQAMTNVFAGLYSLGEDANEQDHDAVRDVLVAGRHNSYVLKPQREGGGYNFYGDRLATKLREHVTISTQQQQDQADIDGTDSNSTTNGTVVTLSPALGEYILMERLFPPQQTAILSRAGKIEGHGDTISELGCFGTILVATTSSGGNDNNITIVHNEYAGFLLRTKFSHIDEGGVASGFATLSSPYLC